MTKSTGQRFRRTLTMAAFGMADLAGDGCWEWFGGRDEKGYGRVRYKKRMHRPHRLAYEVFNGPIPDNMVIDHLCRNHACVRPSHLEVVTWKENALRGIGPTAANAMKTHCKYGHEFDSQHIRTTGNRAGTVERCCRTCQKRLREASRSKPEVRAAKNLASREYKRRKRAEARALRPPETPRTHCGRGHELAVHVVDGRCRTCAAERNAWRYANDPEFRERAKARAKAQRERAPKENHD